MDFINACQSNPVTALAAWVTASFILNSDINFFIPSRAFNILVFFGDPEETCSMIISKSSFKFALSSSGMPISCTLLIACLSKSSKSLLLFTFVIFVEVTVAPGAIKNFKMSSTWAFKNHFCRIFFTYFWNVYFS